MHEIRSDIQILVREPHEVTDEDWTAIATIFHSAYAEANEPYLRRSIERIGRIAIALDGDGAPAAYAIARPRWMDLPGFEEPSLVYLHGMRATVPQHRGRGLIRTLAGALAWASDELREARDRGDVPTLQCGRHGHASRQEPMVEGNHVPWPGRVPTPWQQAVGLAVAEEYGSVLDPTTFVCRGSGQPVGVPNVQFPANEDELTVWAPVDRANGDNLLVISWNPEPPEGWADPDHPFEAVSAG